MNIKSLTLNTNQMSFASPYVEQRSARTSVFYDQINMLIDWNKIEKVINRYYQKNKTIEGRPAYNGVLLFKMLLLGIWNDLSDVKTENLVNDSLSAMRFCKLNLEDNVPDHSTLSRFRTELTENKGMDKILNAFNQQLEKHNLIVKTGVKVDASITESLRKPKGNIRYEIAEDRKEDEVAKEEKDKQTKSLVKLQGKGVDADGRWLKKGGKTRFGFKRHDAVDENGMIVNSGELLKMDFQTIGLQGKYRQLLGDPSVGFFAMVFGLPKSGKSTMCLDFANHLAANHGKVLYCAIEEGFGYTLKEKIERLKAHHPNLFVTDRVPEQLDQFNFVFIDSVSKAGLEVSDMDEMRKMNPNTSFIFIYHTTKEGKFRGVNAHAHEVDVIIEVEKGKATSTGRFNAGGSVEI